MTTRSHVIPVDVHDASFEDVGPCDALLPDLGGHLCTATSDGLSVLAAAEEASEPRSAIIGDA